MDIEMTFKILALTIGVVLILSNFVRVDSLLAKLLPQKNKKPKEVTVDETKDDEKFLHIINLWYQLKENCDDYGLKLAVEKLDEVFPLLNNKKEENTNG